MKKILIIKMSALGDIMIALPHIETITQHHRNDQIWILTGPEHTGLFTGHPLLQVAVLDRQDQIFGNSTRAKILWTRKQQFDCIYDLQGNRTSRLVVRFSGAARKIGTQPRKIYTHHPQLEYTRTTRQNVFDRLNETLQSGGLPPAPPGCPLYLSAKEQQEVIKWKAENNLADGAYALIHAGGSREWVSKRWPEKHYAQLADMIERENIRCIWVGGADESELNKRLASRSGIDASGLFTPLQLSLLGKGACFAVTNDSGPMHILCAAGIPVYSFFGPTDWRRSHGAGQEKRVLITELSCSPCFKGVCPLPGKNACLTSIQPDEVFRRITNVLQHVLRQNRPTIL